MNPEEVCEKSWNISVSDDGLVWDISGSDSHKTLEHVRLVLEDLHRGEARLQEQAAQAAVADAVVRDIVGV